MIILSNQRHKIFFLLLLVVFHLAVNIICLYTGDCNTQLTGKDAWQNHLRYYSFLAERLEKDNWNFNPEKITAKITDIFFVTWDYPPLYYLSAYFLKLVTFNAFPAVIFLTSTVFLILMIVFVYKIGEEIKPGGGLPAAFFASFYPQVLENSRYFNLEIAVCAAAMVSFYFFIKSKSFSVKKESVLLGFSLGIGSLIKYTFAIFFAWLFFLMLWELGVTFKEPKNKSKRFNIISALFFWILFAGAYYFNKEVMEHFIIRAVNADFLFLSTNVLERFIFYSGFICVKMFGPATFLLIIYPAALFFKADIGYKKEMALMLCSAFILAILIPKYPPEAEYLLPFLPVSAVIAGVGMAAIRNGFLKFFLAGVLIISMAVDYPWQNKIHNTCFDKPVKGVSSLFELLGNRPHKVCYLAQEKARVYFPCPSQFLVIWSKNLACLDDYQQRKGKYLVKIDGYDYLIFAHMDKGNSPVCNIAGDDSLKFLKKGEGQILSAHSRFNVFYKLCFYPFPMSPELKINVYFAQKTQTGNFAEEMKTISAKNDALAQEVEFNDIVGYHATVMLANNYSAMGRFDLAQKYYLQAIAMNPGLSYAYLEFANFCLNKAKQLGKDEKSKINFAGLGRSSAFYEKEKLEFYNRASENLEKALILGNRFSLMYGWLFDLAQKFKEARCYDKALKILFRLRMEDKLLEQVYVEFDDLFIRLQKPKETIAFYLYLTEVKPDDYRIALRLARAYKMMQDYEASRKYFDEVLRSAPGCLEAVKGRAGADFFLSLSKTKKYPLQALTEQERLDYKNKLELAESEHKL